MILTLDVGNTQIYGGVFDGPELKLQFRRNSKQGGSSDEIGVFLRTVLRENNIAPEGIHQIALCSVVPEAVYSLKNACKKYFDTTPFILQAGVKTGLNIRYRNPQEVGADRIANAIAAVAMFPKQDLIILDFGTATTFCAVSSDKDYLGGVIAAGVRISMEALESKTARLPSVEILVPNEVVGRGTIESIQSGLYYGNIGMVKEICRQIMTEAFQGRKALIIGTGGFASLFEKAGIFDKQIPDLVFRGLLQVLKMNSALLE